jgi:RNA polymerase sigma factor (sigma-70 family)
MTRKVKIPPCLSDTELEIKIEFYQQVKAKITIGVPDFFNISTERTQSMNTEEEKIGEEENARLEHLINEFIPSLLICAKNQISDRYSSKFDHEDIAQTVLRSVVRRVNSGKIKIGDDDGQFWPLLLTIMKCKIYNRVRSFKTKKRNINRQTHQVEDFQQAFSREADPQDAACFIELIEWLSARLPPQEMEIIQLKLEGRTIREIAEKLGVVKKTVSRKLRIISKVMQEYSVL